MRHAAGRGDTPPGQGLRAASSPRRMRAPPGRALRGGRVLAALLLNSL